MTQRYTCRECGYSFDLTRRGFHTADVKTHGNKIMLVTDMSEQGPRQPLDEKDAEIARLQARIVVLEAAVQAAGVYLTNSTPVNAVKLNDALRKAREEKQGE